MDVVNTVNHVLGLNILEGQAFENADINNDGIVNVIDVVSVVNIVLINLSFNS